MSASRHPGLAEGVGTAGISFGAILLNRSLRSGPKLCY
jgi:hypothetical protein